MLRRAIGVAILGGVIMSAGAAEVKDNCPMVWIPPGECLIGTTPEQAAQIAKEAGFHPEALKWETPRKKVVLKGFLIDKYPVTNRQYKAYLDDTKQPAPRNWSDGRIPKGEEDHPVSDVNQKQAAAYAEWAGKRLPTAEEWEKAARGEDGRLYPWGNEWDEDATRRDQPDKWPVSRALRTPIGCFPKGASPYGVMDMCGNVAEWTGTLVNRANDDNRPKVFGIVKGAGGAQCMKHNFRCAARNLSGHWTRRHDWLGFRCAMDAPEKPASLPEDTTPKRAPPPIPPVELESAPEKYGKAPVEIEPMQAKAIQFTCPYLPGATWSTNLTEATVVSGASLWHEIKRDRAVWKKDETTGDHFYEVEMPGVLRQRVNVRGGIDCVEYDLVLTNLGDKPQRPSTNVCFNNSGAPRFEDIERVRSYVFTDKGPTLIAEMPVAGAGNPHHGGWPVASEEQESTPENGLVRYPLIAVQSRDGQWMTAHAYGEGRSVASNAHYTCLHSNPGWPELAPGQSVKQTARFYFFKGSPEELLERWKKDYGK